MARLKAPQAKIPKPPISLSDYLTGGTDTPAPTGGVLKPVTTREQQTVEAAVQTGMVGEQWGKSLEAQPGELLEITKQTPKALANYFGSFIGLGLGQPSQWAKKSGVGWAQNIPVVGFAFSKAAAEQATSFKETAKDIYYFMADENFGKFDETTGKFNPNANPKRDRISKALAEGRPIGGLLIEDLGNISLVGSLFTRGARIKANASEINAEQAAAKAAAATGPGRTSFEQMAADYADDAARWRERQARWGKRTRVAERIGAAPIYAYTVPFKAAKWAAKSSGRYTAEWLRARANIQEQAGALDKAANNRNIADQLGRLFGSPITDPDGNIVYEVDSKGRARPKYVDRSDLLQWSKDRNRRVEARGAAATREGLAILTKPAAYDEINPDTGQPWGPLSPDEQAAVMAIRNGRSTLLRFVQDALPEFTLDELVGMGSRSNDVGYNLTPEGARLAIEFERSRETGVDNIQMRRLAEGVGAVSGYIETYLGMPARKGTGTARLDPTTGEYRRDPLDPYQDYPVPNVDRFRQALVDTPMSPTEQAQAAAVLEILDRFIELGLGEMPVGDPLRLQLIAGLVEAAPDPVIGNTSIWPAKERNRIEEIKAIREDLAQRGATQVVGRPFPEGGPGSEPQPLAEDPATGLPNAEDILTRRLPGQMPRSGMAYMRRSISKLKKLKGRAHKLARQVTDTEIAIDAAERQIVKQRLQLQEIEGFYVNRFGRIVFPNAKGQLPRGAKKVPGLLDEARAARDKQLELYEQMVAAQEATRVVEGREVSRETIAENIETLDKTIANLEAVVEGVIQATELITRTIEELNDHSAKVAAALAELGIDADELRLAAQEDIMLQPEDGPLRIDVPEELEFLNVFFGRLHDRALAKHRAENTSTTDVELAQQRVIAAIDELRASGEDNPALLEQLRNTYRELQRINNDFWLDEYRIEYDSYGALEELAQMIVALPEAMKFDVMNKIAALLQQLRSDQLGLDLKDYFFGDEYPSRADAREAVGNARQALAYMQVRSFAGDEALFDVNYDPALAAHTIRHRGLTYVFTDGFYNEKNVVLKRLFDIDEPGLSVDFPITEAQVVAKFPTKDIFGTGKVAIDKLGRTEATLKKNWTSNAVFDAIKADVAKILSSEKGAAKTTKTKKPSEAEQAQARYEELATKAADLTARYEEQQAAQTPEPEPTPPAVRRLTIDELIPLLEKEIATGRISTKQLNAIKKLLSDEYKLLDKKASDKALDSNIADELVGRGTGRGALVYERDGKLYTTNGYFLIELKPGNVLYDKLKEQGFAGGIYMSSAASKADVKAAPLTQTSDKPPSIGTMLDRAQTEKTAPATIVGIRHGKDGNTVILETADGTRRVVQETYLNIVMNADRVLEISEQETFPIVVKEGGQVVGLLMPLRLTQNVPELRTPEEKVSVAAEMLSNRNLKADIERAFVASPEPAAKPKLAKPTVTEEQVTVAQLAAQNALEAAQMLRDAEAYDAEKAATRSTGDKAMDSATAKISVWRKNVEQERAIEATSRGFDEARGVLQNLVSEIESLTTAILDIDESPQPTVLKLVDRPRARHATVEQFLADPQIGVANIEQAIVAIDAALATYEKIGVFNTSASDLLVDSLEVALTDNEMLIDTQIYDPTATRAFKETLEQFRADLETKAAQVVSEAPAAEVAAVANNAGVRQVNPYDPKQYRTIAPGIIEFETGTRTYRIVKRERPINPNKPSTRKFYDFIVQRVATDGQTIESTTLVFKTKKAYQAYIKESMDIDTALANKADPPIDAPALMPPKTDVWPKDLLDAEARLAKVEGRRVSLLRGLASNEAKLLKVRVQQAKNRALLERTEAAATRLEARLGREVITTPGLEQVEGVPAKADPGLEALVRPSQRLEQQAQSVDALQPDAQKRAEFELVAKSLEEAAFLGRRQRVPISMAMRAAMSREPESVGVIETPESRSEVTTYGSGYVPARSPQSGEPGPKKAITEGLRGFRKLSRQRYRTGEYSEIYDLRELIKTVVSEQRAMDQNEAIFALMNSSFAVAAVELLGEEAIDRINRESYDYVLNELEAYKAGRLDRDRYFEYRVEQQVGARIRAEMAKRGWVTNPGEYTAIDAPVSDNLIKGFTKFLPRYAVEAVAERVSFADPNAVGRYLKTVRYGTKLFKNLTLPLSITWQLGDIISTFILSAMTDVPLTDLVIQMRKAYDQNYGGGIREIFKPETDRTVGQVGQFIAESGLQDVGLRLEERSVLRGMEPELKAPFSHRIPVIGIVPRGYGRFREAAYRFNEFTNRIGRQAYFMARLDQALRDYNASSGRDPIAIEDIAKMRLDETNLELHKLFWDTINQANDVMGDWMDLNAFERRVVMPHVTFYAWIKHINKLFVRISMNDPAKIMWYMYLGQMAYDPDTDPFGIFGGLVRSFIPGNMARIDFAGPLSDVANGPLGATLANIFSDEVNEPSIQPLFSMFSPVPRLLAAIPGVSMRRGLQPLQRPPAMQSYTKSGRGGTPELLPLSRQGRSELIGVTVDTFPLLRKLADLMPTGTIPGTDVQLGPYKTYETGYARTRPGTPIKVEKPGGRLGALLNLFNVPFRPSISNRQLQEENLRALQDTTRSQVRELRLQALQEYVNG